MKIRIKSKTHSFWRCGIQFTQEGNDFESGDFTPEQMNILKAEPNLTVEEVVGKKPEPEAEKKSGKKEKKIIDPTA